MKKTLKKRWLCVILSLLCILTTATPAFAAESTNIVNQNGIETNEAIMPRATLGSLVFNLLNFGNSNQTALVSNGSQKISFARSPQTLSYVALPSNNTGTVWLYFSNNSAPIKLEADGIVHTIPIHNNAIPANQSITVRYSGANVPLVSISLVFGD